MTYFLLLFFFFFLSPFSVFSFFESPSPPYPPLCLHRRHTRKSIFLSRNRRVYFLLFFLDFSKICITNTGIIFNIQDIEFNSEMRNKKLASLAYEQFFWYDETAIIWLIRARLMAICIVTSLIFHFYRSTLWSCWSRLMNQTIPILQNLLCIIVFALLIGGKGAVFWVNLIYILV